VRRHLPISDNDIVRIRSKHALQRFRVDENAVGAVLRIHTAGRPHGQRWFILNESARLEFGPEARVSLRIGTLQVPQTDRWGLVGRA